MSPTSTSARPGGPLRLVRGMRQGPRRRVSDTTGRHAGGYGGGRLHRLHRQQPVGQPRPEPLGSCLPASRTEPSFNDGQALPR